MIQKSLTGRVLITLFLMLVLAPLTLRAQDSLLTGSDDPFWDMLATVPDDDIAHNELAELNYTNYRALAEAWQVADVTDDDLLNETDKGKLWMSLMAVPQNLVVAATSAFVPAMQDTMGFTMLDVHQALHYGWPPVDGYIVTGDFDLDSVRAALASRNFAPYDIPDIELWCGDVGCDNGKQQVLSDSDPTNIFGGILGRKEPLVLQSGLLLDSPSLTTLSGMVGVQQEKISSLLERPEYRAFAETVTAQGTVLEAYTFDAGLISTWSDFHLPESILPKVLESAGAFGELPAYDFVWFAHVWNEGEFYAQIILLYGDAETAETAGQEVYTRLMNAAPMSNRAYSTYQEQFAAVANGELLPPSVYVGQDYAAAIVSWRWSLPAGDMPTDVYDPYYLLKNTLSRRDLYFLGVDFVLPR